MPAAVEASTGALPEEVIIMDTSQASDLAELQAPGEHITVALIPKVEEDLRLLQERTSLSKTDLTNRAITLYEFFDARWRAGHDLLDRDNSTGQSQLVYIDTTAVQAPGVQAPAVQAQRAGHAWHRRRPADHRRRPSRRWRLHPSPSRPLRLAICSLLPLLSLIGQEARTP
jgi:hypothetical protein